MKILFGLLLISTTVMAQPNSGPAPVGVTNITRHRIQSRISLTGTVQSNNRTTLASEVNGNVANVQVLPGMTFKKGDIIMELDRTFLEFQKNAAHASMEEARANWELAALRQERSVSMFQKELISQNDNDTYVLSSTAARARYQNAEAVFQQLDYQYNQSQIRAPYDGILTLQHVFVGDWVRQGDPVATLVSTEKAEIWVQIPEQYYSPKLSGSNVPVFFPQNLNLTVTGTIRALVPQADEQSHTFPVVIDIAHSQAFGFGMMVKTEIPTGHTGEVLLAPKDAIIFKGSSANVWLVNEDMSIRMEQVQTGQSEGAWIEITGNISEGQPVITRGNERLFPGMKVAPETVEYPLP